MKRQGARGRALSAVLYALCRHKGFTLLEVVVAMAIVGLGVVTLFEIFSLGLRLGSRSSAKSEAMTFGTQAIDEVLIRRKLPEGIEEGSSAGRYRWQVDVKPFQEGAALLSASGWELKEVALAVRYRDAEGEKAIEMRTLRLVKGKAP